MPNCGRKHPRIGRRRIGRAAPIRRKQIRFEVQQPRVRHGRVDGLARHHRHDDKRHAARDLLDGQPGRANVAIGNAQRGGDAAHIIERPAELGILLRHPREAQADRAIHSSETGVGPMFNPNDQSARPRRDASISRERERAADDRVARHRHLVAGRKDPHAHVGAGLFGRRHERRLGEADLPGNLLHRLRPADQPPPGNTASWLPPKRRSVNTS